MAITRDTNLLKQMIFEYLNSDVTLRTLLGGTGNRVRYGNPKSKAEYPLVAYSILTDIDEPYNADVATGTAQTELMIQVFSSESSSMSVDNIEARVYELLHGHPFYNESNVRTYSCYRKTRTPVYEPAIEIWRIDCRYTIVNVIK